MRVRFVAVAAVLALSCKRPADATPDGSMILDWRDPSEGKLTRFSGGIRR